MAVQPSIARLNRVIHVLRKLDDEAGLHQVTALLYIASNEGCSINELTEHIGKTSAAGTRIIARLGEGSYRQEGLGLILSEVDPRDRRVRKLSMTPKGRQLLKTIDGILGGESHGSS